MEAVAVADAVSEAPFGPRRLGLIIPVVTGAHVGRVEDPETRHYERWIRRFGLPEVRTVEAFTPADGRHEVASVFDTGREDQLVAAARELAEAGSEVVTWPCTCASFIGGLAWSRAQAEAMARAAGRPATSTSLAMLEAVRALGAPLVDVVSAYPAPTTHRLLRFLDDADVGVAAMVSLDCTDELQSFELDIRREVLRFDGALSARSHPLLIPDTAISTVGLVGEIEAAIGRPVITGNQATLWHSLHLLGLHCRTPEHGVLLGGVRPASRVGS